MQLKIRFYWCPTGHRGLRDRQQVLGVGSIIQHADLDFSAIPNLDIALVQDMDRAEYFAMRASILLVGNPDLGKTLIA